MTKIKFLDILEASDELKEKVRQWRNKKTVRRYMLNQHKITKREHLKWLEKLKQRDNQKFWIVFVNKVPIGSIYLEDIDYKKLTSGWGLYIGESAYRNKGLSKGIIFKLLNIFFDEMKFEILFTKVLSNNIVALSLYEKFKFKKVNRLPFKKKEEIIFLKFSKNDWMRFKKKLSNVSKF